MSDHKIYRKRECYHLLLNQHRVYAMEGGSSQDCPNATYADESFNPHACIAVQGDSVSSCIHCVGEGNDFVVCSHERGNKPEVPAPWFRLLPRHEAAGGA